MKVFLMLCKILIHKPLRERKQISYLFINYGVRKPFRFNSGLLTGLPDKMNS